MGWFSKPKQMRPIVRMCGTKPEWARLQIERRRNEALKLVAPPVQQGMLAILGDKRRIDPIKYLRTELACTLVDAKDIIDTIDSWWPDGDGGRDRFGTTEFRRGLIHVTGRNDKDFQKLRVERASQKDEEDDPRVGAPPG